MVSTQLLGLGLTAAVGADHLVPSLGQVDSHGPAQAAADAGNDRDLLVRHSPRLPTAPGVAPGAVRWADSAFRRPALP